MHTLLYRHGLRSDMAMVSSQYSFLPGDEVEEVLGMLGSLLTTVRPLPLGMFGSPPEAMGTVTVPGVLLVTTMTCPSVF